MYAIVCICAYVYEKGSKYEERAFCWKWRHQKVSKSVVPDISWTNPGGSLCRSETPQLGQNSPKLMRNHQKGWKDSIVWSGLGAGGEWFCFCALVCRRTLWACCSTLAMFCCSCRLSLESRGDNKPWISRIQYRGARACLLNFCLLRGRGRRAL